MREEKLLYISKELENHIFIRNWIFRHTCMYKEPTLIKYWNHNVFVQILYNYFRYTDRLFLGYVRIVARCDIIRASWLSYRKIELHIKVHRRIYVRDIIFWLHALLPMSFLLLSLSTPSPFPSDLLAEWPLYRYIILLRVVFCVMISWVNGQNAIWLAPLRAWYYVRLCFSCRCSGYDHTLIKKSHKLNCYSLLQKFLLKTKNSQTRCR